MANGAIGAGPTPPYCPWSTFTGFLTGLKGHPIPARVDNSLLTNMSGSTQSQLRGALRFFGAVQGEEDEKTVRLDKLVRAVGTEEWGGVLAEIVPEAYVAILEGVDLKAGTEAQLKEAFREKGGASGSVADKAVRFFLAAMGDAEIKVSSHFGTTRTSGGGNGGRRTRPSRPRRTKKQATTEENAPVADDMEEIVFSMPGGRTIKVRVPKGLSAVEQDYVVSSIQNYFMLGREAK